MNFVLHRFIVYDNTFLMLIINLRRKRFREKGSFFDFLPHENRGGRKNLDEPRASSFFF